MPGHFRFKRDKLFHSRNIGVLWIIAIMLLTLLGYFSECHWSQVTRWRLCGLARFHQMQVLAQAPVECFKRFILVCSQRYDWYQHYQQLLTKQRYFDAQITQIEALQRENQILINLLNLIQDKATVPNNWQAATLISMPYKQFKYRFIINKGANDKVHSNYMVINEQGVVGRVDLTSQHTSVILPLISADSVVPVQVERTGYNCFCVGAGPSKLMLLNVSYSADIRAGDRLITSSLGGSWLPGYLIGLVQKVSKTNEQTFLEVEVKPAVDCWCLRHVLLLQTYE